MKRKPGLRVQLLLLLAGLLLGAFLPLHLAVATYVHVTLRRIDAEQLAHCDSVDRSGLGGQSRAGSRAEQEQVEVGSAPELGAALQPHQQKAAGAAQRHKRTREALGAASRRGPALLQLLGLYSLVLATGLAVLGYWGLTRLIVRPLDRLAQAAQNVTLGSRALSLPQFRSRELSELGGSLSRMTARLFDEESRLRQQVVEVEARTAELRRAQAQLVQSERLASVGRLSAGLAHEVGNPLAALMGLQDAVIAGDLSRAEQHDFLQRMRSETERIHRILRDLLDFARPAQLAQRAGRAESAAGDVERAVSETVALLQPQPGLRALQLEVALEPDLPLVTLSQQALAQVLLNLSLNAIDAQRGQESGVLRLSAKRQPRRERQPGAQRQTPGVRLAVEDAGPGVAPEARAHVFEPFFTTKPVGEGTGLGLSVCQGLVAAAGGEMRLDEKYAAGARFVIELPAAPEQRRPDRR